jgi:phospholipase/lecithinase/hemolysin
VQKVVPCLVGFLLLGSAVVPAQTNFNALYIFGDGLSTTTNNSSTGPLYYGKRYSNGRVWVEVLAQRQGMLYDSNKNWSYFFNSSTTLVTHVNNFSAPSDASNSLFVIWVNCADLWFPAKYDGTSMSPWTNAINQSQINHYKAVTNLYFAKGARSLIMPNAVDLSIIPEFNKSSNTNFIHLRCLEYNVAFSNTLNWIRASCSNLTLYAPDFSALLTNMVAYATNYGLTNALGNGKSIDALHAQYFGMPSAATNGFGTNFIFWNEDNPTAMVHAWMANTAQQLISPAQISQLVTLDDSNRLDLANVPIGQNGLVLGCTNLAMPNWKTNSPPFVGTNVTQSVYVPATNAPMYYRLKYLYSWTWP